MKSETNNKEKVVDKIEYFPDERNDAEFDEFFKQRLLRDSDMLEKELNEDPDLSDIKAPDDMFAKIVTELKTMGVWEEEERVEYEEPEEAEVEKPVLSTEEIYALLPEADQKAMSVGKKILARGKCYRFRKVAVAVVAVFVLVFGVSMTSGANRLYMMDFIKSLSGENVNVKINTRKDSITMTDEEQEARQEIKNGLEIESIPYFLYQPQGMEYVNYSLNERLKQGNIFYKADGKTTTIYMYKQKEEQGATYRYLATGSVVETIYAESIRAELDIIKMNKEEEEKGKRYATQFVFNGTYYAIWTDMDTEELKSVVKGMLM